MTQLTGCRLMSVNYSRLTLYVVGTILILLAIASYLTEQRISDLFVWLQQVFGWGYAFIYGGLVGVGMYSWHCLLDKEDKNYWFEVGLQAAGGIATLSLTFTLLGISLGIGSLADKTIEPDTIQVIIQDITRHFSTAFMTTVVGLPTANILRTAVSLRYVRIQNTDNKV